MADRGVFHSLLDDPFLRLEPIVLLGDELYVRSGQTLGAGAFVTALGREHPLRRFCSRRTLNEVLVRRNAGAVGDLIRSGLSRVWAENQLDDLRYFVEGLLPAFQGRDWSEHFEIDSFPGQAAPDCRDDVIGQIHELAQAFPTPALPTPSYLLLGRFRMLDSDQPDAQGDHVRLGETILRPTGETVTIGQIERRWRESVKAFVACAVGRLVDAAGDPAPSTAVIAAREELARTGCLERGDLLFLAGQPPRVGHVLPRHYNRVLGRQSHRDLAMTMALSRPPQISTVEVFARDSRGRWFPYALPHGLCLGGSPPEHRPETPGLAVLAYLRWAACRIASNGVFHASDDQSPEYEP